MIPLSVLRAHLRQPPVADDGLIRDYEQAAVDYIEGRTGRYFGPPASTTSYLSGNGQRELWLADEPSGTVTVTVDGVALDAADFSVRGRRLRHATKWPVGADVVVTYTAGYPATGTGEEQDVAAPAAIREAVLELVTLFYEERLPVVVGSIAAPMPHRVAEVIALHQRITV